LVVIAERIEQAVQMGRITDPVKRGVLLDVGRKLKFTTLEMRAKRGRKLTKITTISSPLYPLPPYPT
jgi:hypothetical protein